MHKNLFVFATTLLTVFSCTLFAQSRDSFHIATTTKSNDTLIRVYNADGTLRGDVPITYNFRSSEFIAGEWLGPDTVSVIAVQFDDKNKATAYILDHMGSVVKEFSIGKDIFSAHAINFNGAGATDLLVQYKEKDELTVYLEPGLSSVVQTASIISPNRTDPIIQATLGTDKIAYLKIPDPNLVKTKGSNSKKGKKKRRLLKRGKKKGTKRSVQP
ncbi:MAG: hypothetical protein KDD62_15095, partial [Bdellovibrionales bacterium]|nr:hypothetical protein [Bdellovibrionales bacterium]